MNKINILLADNNQSYLEIARKMLRFHDESFLIDVATSVEDCIDKLLEKHYQLLLLDYEIDGGRGFDILSGITNFSLNVPVVMMLNEGNDELSQEVIARGAVDYIVKVRGHLTTLPIAVSKILNKLPKKYQDIKTKDIFEEEKKIIPPAKVEKAEKATVESQVVDGMRISDEQHEVPKEKPVASIKKEFDLDEELKKMKLEEKADEDTLFSLLASKKESEPEEVEKTEKDETNAERLSTPPYIDETEPSKIEAKSPEIPLPKATILAEEEEVAQPPTSAPEETKIHDLSEEKLSEPEKSQKPFEFPSKAEGKTRKPAFEKSETHLFLSDENLAEGNEGYSIQDRKGRFVSVNEVLQKKLNYAEEELLELALEDILYAENLPDYYQWLARVDKETTDKPLNTKMVGKHGDLLPVEISLIPERDDENEITHYRGTIKFKSPVHGAPFPINGYFDQSKMIQNMTMLIRISYDCSLNHLLEKIAQLVCKTFQFQRATLALLDRRRRAFVKQIMIGYTNGKADGKRILEVPQEVIDKVFTDKFKVRVIYQDQDLDSRKATLPIMDERRLQRRDDRNLWKPNNVIIFNLTDAVGNTFGYISMDEPVKPVVPTREIFHNMEIFTNLTSLAIENFYRYSSVEKRNRRLKRLLVTGNIFKLNLSGSEIMKDSVWSIKFSLDFNLVLIGMINVETNQIEIKAAACDDRIKTIHLKEFKIPVKELRPVFKKEYAIGKSYFLSKQEPIFNRLKDIYYDLKIESEEERYWQWWNLLIVPIYERHKNIVGFIIADDPSDCLLPSKETIHTLEIFANQLSIAIENRVTYLHLQGKIKTGDHNPVAKSDESEGGLNRLVEIFFK